MKDEKDFQNTQKIMALKYVVTKQIFGFDESRTEKFVPVQVLSGEVSFKKLCTQVCQICGAHRGTVNLVIAGLVDALVNNLDNGSSVQLGEFGIFKPAIRAKASDTEEDVSVDNIYRRRINFTPGLALKDVMNKVSINRFTPPVTDYTTNSSTNEDDEQGSF